MSGAGRSRRLGRRRFLEQLGAGGLAVLAAPDCRPRSSTPPDASSATAQEASAPELRTFTAATFATLSAVCERLLPRDADPGALDLGVPGYIDRALANPELSSVRETVLRVMPLLDRQARERLAGKAFHEGTPAEQDEILGLWERGRDGGQRFLPVMLDLTLEGAFGDPRYGGNRGGKGFAMIGFRPDPPLHKMAGHAMAHDAGATD